ncbi:ParA family protein (plasmid) [Bartonella apihabitans]|nr:ParA family protein [Bartonella apihabitans]WLT07739.1 ParA family protein [Bartonella apihabitans]
MAKTIAFVSGKGGAGKTTAAIMVAGEYDANKKRTLMIDTDARQNLSEWWTVSEKKGNIPANMNVRAAVRSADINELLEQSAEKYDLIVIDTPGVDSQIRDIVLRNADVVVTPVQPNRDEIRAAAEAAAWIADVSNAVGREIPQLLLKTRISVTNRLSEAYRLIRPFVSNLQQNGYNVSMLVQEMYERNCYRDVRSGYGTLQMMPLNETIKKARLEVRKIAAEIDKYL